MSNTTFSGPVRVGTIKDPITQQNVGRVLCMQHWKYDIPGLALTNMTTGAVTALTLAAGTFDSSIYIPSGSVITNFYADVDVVYNQGSTAAATIGTAAGGTQYVTTMDLKGATGRIAPTFTAAQLLAMNSAAVDTAASAAAGTNTARVFLRITSTGTNASTGHGYIYVFYQPA